MKGRDVNINRNIKDINFKDRFFIIYIVKQINLTIIDSKYKSGMKGRRCVDHTQNNEENKEISKRFT